MRRVGFHSEIFAPLIALEEFHKSNGVSHKRPYRTLSQLRVGFIRGKIRFRQDDLLPDKKSDQRKIEVG